MLSRRTAIVGLLLAMLLSLLHADAAAAQPAQSAQPPDSPEQELAERYAPIVMVKTQEEECDSDGEPFRPMSVEPLFDNRQIALRQVGNDDPTVMWAPEASDILGHGKGFYLDFPGSSLQPGCVYERDFRAFVEEAGTPPTIYAHVVVQEDRPDELVLQYWFYWYFNDWNNTHESDWEMIQIVFPASSAEEALQVDPSEVGYAQHEGGERAEWTDDKLDREGSRPVVYPSAGSHASYYGSALYLGRNGSEGFGCDNTDGPSTRVDPEVVLLPDEPVDDPDDPLAWTSFSGRWGERQTGPFNGPDGPYQKTRFLEPLDWQDDLRSSSAVVPAGDTQADSLVRAFCGIVEWGSNQLLQFKLSPWRAVVTIAVVGGLALYIVRRTRWNLVPPLPVVRRRRAGQIVRASFRAFGRAPTTFLFVGLLSIPIALLAGLISVVVRWIPFAGDLVALFDTGEIARLVMSVLVGSIAHVLTLVIVSAAAAWTMGELSAGRQPTAAGLLRALRENGSELAHGFARAAAIVVLLLISFVGIPWAIRQLVRYQFLPHTVMLEGATGRQALARSTELIRGRWWHTGLFIGIIDLILALGFSVVGLLILIVVRPPFWALTMIMGIASILVLPLATIATTLLYGDAVQEKATAPPSSEEDELVTV